MGILLYQCDECKGIFRTGGQECIYESVKEAISLRGIKTAKPITTADGRTICPKCWKRYAGQEVV